MTEIEEDDINWNWEYFYEFFLFFSVGDRLGRFLIFGIRWMFVIYFLSYFRIIKDSDYLSRKEESWGVGLVVGFMCVICKFCNYEEGLFCLLF